MKKTFYAPGYMDLTLILGTACAPVKVEFTGGSSSGYGSAPARFSTEDPILQILIEDSAEYKNGLIRDK